MSQDFIFQTRREFRRDPRAPKQRLHPLRAPCRIRRNGVRRQPAQIDNERYLSHVEPPNANFQSVCAPSPRNPVNDNFPKCTRRRARGNRHTAFMTRS